MTIILTSKQLPCALVVAALCASGCAGSGALTALRAGQIEDARRSLAAEVSTGDISEDETRDLAAAMLARDIAAARGGAGALVIARTAACARFVDDDLAEKAGGNDASANEAAMARMGAGLASAEDKTSYAARRGEPLMAPSAARALVFGPDATARRALWLSGDPAVRRGALRASIEAMDPGDRDGLLEAARLDPDPVARGLAIRALGQLGGDRVVLGLADRWANADEIERQAIVDAWATPGCFEAGGARELLRVVDGSDGAPAIAAASALARLGGAGNEAALATLVRNIEGGLARDRIYAMLVAPLGHAAARQAIVEAQNDAEASVAMTAKSRLFEAPEAQGGASAKERTTLEKELLTAAEGETRQALAARGTLARAGARAVLPILEKALGSKDAAVRANAASGLVDLGEIAKVAPLVLDADVGVRVEVACHVVRAPTL